MTQLIGQLDLLLSIGIAAFRGPVGQRSCRPAERKPAPSLVGGEIQAVLQDLSILKRIGLEVMRPCGRMRDRHVSD